MSGKSCGRSTRVLAFCALPLTLALVVLHTPLQQFDGWVADRMQEVQGTRSAPSDIVLLEYDEITRSQAAEADLLAGGHRAC